MFLHPEIKAYFVSSKPVFEQIMGLEGECFRNQKGRITKKVLIGTKHYFIKTHRGIGWKEVFKNLLQLRLPVISADNEWRAISKLQSLNIPVPKIMGYGKKGLNPARLQSFIILEELSDVISLETLCQNWKEEKPTFSYKTKLIEEIAVIARTLHQNGMNHKDFYLCHFLLDTSCENDKIKLHLIDLHRAEIRRKMPKRWLIKDLAALYFSSLDAGFTKRDFYRFMQYYSKQSLRFLMDTNQGFWLKVKSRGEKLYRDQHSHA